MRKLVNLIVYLLLIYVVYVALINSAQTLTFHVGAVKSLVDLGIPQLAATINFGIYTIILLIFGFVVGMILVGQFYFAEKDKLKAYKRELEKSSISNSTNSSRVEVLEAKIATLEKALDDALGKN